ncbi:MAG: RdgB/HAM1 family non-canonical purine NTP pyrophosphatase [Acidobacteria bacterium]|nr:RdgB/HAM1 family non-canonical purine NTP pyrophosphatase [Acidobacteriota bacterium]
MKPTIVIATRNSGKLREFQNLLLPVGSEILSLKDVSIEQEFEESGQTFAENARLKAIAYSRLTQFPVLADDSGLEVAALGGRPGIHSARYAGSGASDSDRIRKLLQELSPFPGSRDARFVCALSLAQDGNILLESEGECRGIIIDEPRGANGFGYDPIFLFTELGITFAELSESEKNLYSHRAHAVTSLIQKLHGFSIVNLQQQIVNRKS